MGNNKNRLVRYLYLMQSDGIGTQFIYISRLLDYVTEADCKLIVDFRKMAFFWGWGVSCDETELNKVFFFYTDRIIYSPSEIDRIVREHADEIVGVRFCPEKFNPTDWPLPVIWANDLLHTAGSNDSACCLKDKWKLVGEYEEMFNEYQGAVSSCVGVHARLGNGEQNLSESWQRMKIPWDRFFLEMDSCQDDKFFVCADTPSFVDKCSDRYGDRVIYLDRFMPPENCGPGHNIWSIYDKKKASEYITERTHVGPYRLIGEALIEMFLLGECKRLVCNKSSFTHYARECCHVDAVVLECTKNESEIYVCGE